MTYRPQTCITIACDVYDYVLGTADDGPQHYTTEADALKYAKVQGWHQLADGRVVCEDEQHAALLAADAVDRFETVGGAA